MSEYWYPSYKQEVPFESLVGKTLTNIEGLQERSKKVTLVTDDGGKFAMYHVQDCCEYVRVEEVIGDPHHLLNTPIVIAEESRSREEFPNGSLAESGTWTFYTLRTHKGTVVIRWLGESNGYYGEEVGLYRKE